MVGLVEVAALPDNDFISPPREAFVNAFSVAAGRDNYEELVGRMLRDLRFEVRGFEQVETFDDRVAREGANSAYSELAQEAQNNGSVVFGSFHSYDAK